MEDSSFSKMKKSDTPLPGNRQLLLCGMKPKEQDLIKKIVKKCHVTVPLVFPSDEQGESTLDELNALAAGTGYGKRSSHHRAIIAAGITEKEFMRILERTKESTLDRPLWATFTDTSREWKLTRLLNELFRERSVMG